ncbi:hypothetical protein RM543_11990 [Roseicyclus sp. F158]|uniref:Uncharacterized protein n=1 Tax=Tropicimonas omnivorans TaxID=3075590 RepID=A0ABU3DI71_9RHOB|nr:hypothetical protein [Roseicyclus sp. F158]MDT0683409.1 hypothetical protein [Roseicyclus sp. F158]
MKIWTKGDLDPAKSRTFELEDYMFDQIQSPSLFTSSDPVASLRDFVVSHREGLLHAAGLLGGKRGTGLVLEILEELSSARPVSRRTRTRVIALIELLSLERVHELGSEECFYFAAIDPCDPVVEEICLLTDGLRDALPLASPHHRQPPEF